MRPARLLLVILSAGLLAASLLAIGPAGGATPQGAPDQLCSLLDRSDVREQISGAGERALKVHCGLIARPAGNPSDTRHGAGIPSAPDVLVNDRSTDTWPQITQSETTVAVAKSVLLAGWNDSGEFFPNGDFSGYGRSTDRGASWTDMRTPTTPLDGVSGVFGDPVLMADRDRNPGDNKVFYFANLGEATNGDAIISVHKSTDGGLTWDSAADASPNAPSSAFPDKEWMAVDNRPSGQGAGNVYVCYRSFGGTEGIHFSRSTNGGQTFTELAGTISADGPFTQGCFVAVNPVNGHVYVTWRNTSTTPLTMRFRRSTNFGQTFGPEVTVGQFPAPENNTSACGRPAFVDDEPNASQRAIRSGAFPWLAVHPTSGTIGLVAHRAGLAGGSESDIAYTSSSDGGATWSAQVRVNTATTGQQFFPSLAVNQLGNLRAMYYSTQRSATDRLIDVYSATSSDFGGTWSASQRITDVSFDRPITNPNFDTLVVNCYMGDYNTVHSPPAGLGGNQFYLAWGDNRLDGNPGQGGVQPDPDVRFELKR